MYFSKALKAFSMWHQFHPWQLDSLQKAFQKETRGLKVWFREWWELWLNWKNVLKTLCTWCLCVINKRQPNSTHHGITATCQAVSTDQSTPALLWRFALRYTELIVFSPFWAECVLSLCIGVHASLLFLRYRVTLDSSEVKAETSLPL